MVSRNLNFQSIINLDILIFRSALSSAKKEIVEIVKSVDSSKSDHYKKILPSKELIKSIKETTSETRMSTVSESLKNTTKKDGFVTASDFFKKSIETSEKKNADVKNGVANKNINTSNCSNTSNNRDKKNMIEIISSGESDKTKKHNFNQNDSSRLSVRKKISTESGRKNNESENINFFSVSEFLNKSLDKPEMCDINLNCDNAVISPVQSNKSELKGAISLSDLSNNKFIDLSSPITRRDRETAKVINFCCYFYKLLKPSHLIPKYHSQCGA